MRRAVELDSLSEPAGKESLRLQIAMDPMSRLMSTPLQTLLKKSFRDDLADHAEPQGEAAPARCGWAYTRAVSGPRSHKSAREHELAQQLDLARREAGLTTAQLAGALFCAARTVRRYMNAERRPPRQIVQNWETVCGLRPGRLTEIYDRVDVPEAEARSSGRIPRETFPRVRFNLPPVAASFSGRREELAALDAALRLTDRAVITQAITGLGGVGKSQLAARYVQQYVEHYDVVAWIRAEDGGIADLAALAAKLGEDVEGLLSPYDRAQLALDWLSATRLESRWLLVLDNVQSPQQLERLLPRAGNGRVLVTSRDHALRELAPVLTIDVFDEDVATAYLTERAGRPADEPDARTLARTLGCLPLALSHAAAYCQSGTSFATYLELLAGLPARELFDSQPEFYAQTVAATWNASVEAAQAAAPLAEDVLEMAAYLAPDDIPKMLFGALVELDTAVGQKRLVDAFNALARFSLATVGDETLSVHRLLQKTIRDNRKGETPAMRALAAMRDAFPQDGSIPAHWTLCERLLPHTLALADTMREPASAGGDLLDLVNRGCWYLNNAEPGSRRSLAIARGNVRTADRVLGRDHPQLLMSRNHLATALHWSGQIREAIEIFESVAVDRERILGPDHDHTLDQPQQSGPRLSGRRAHRRGDRHL